MRAVIRRLNQLEQKLAPRPIPPISFRIQLIHPENGLTGILLIESDKPTTHILPTEDERKLTAPGGKLQLPRAISRRLERLETKRALATSQAEWIPHTIVFVGMDRKPVSAWMWDPEKGTTVWVEGDPDEVARRIGR